MSRVASFISPVRYNLYAGQIKAKVAVLAIMIVIIPCVMSKAQGNNETGNINMANSKINQELPFTLPSIKGNILKPAFK